MAQYSTQLWYHSVVAATLIALQNPTFCNSVKPAPPPDPATGGRNRFRCHTRRPVSPARSDRHGIRAGLPERLSSHFDDRLKNLPHQAKTKLRKCRINFFTSFCPRKSCL